jgi:3-oxoacyl-(acyl-carrier-protein) synthase
MNTPVSIVSHGICSPAGIGLDALLATDSWPTRRVAEVSRPEVFHGVALMDSSSGYRARWQSRPRFRRAGDLTLHIAESVSQALAAAPHADPKRTGIVGAFFLGCISYSVKFYQGILKDGRRFASPVLFPETVANSPLGHVASELGIGGPVYSQVGDTSCWSSALRTACVLLHTMQADHVVVVGAEEFDPHQLDAFAAAGWFRSGEPLHIAEGAGAILLERGLRSGGVAIGKAVDGFSFRTKREGAAAAAACLAEFDAGIPVADTASSWMRAAVRTRNSASLNDGPRFEAFNASCAWNTILAAEQIRGGATDRLVVPYFGLSQNIGAALLSRSDILENAGSAVSFPAP